MLAGRFDSYHSGVRGVLIALAAALAAISAAAQDSAVERGYTHFYNLEYPEAIAEFEHALAANPSDPELHNHLAQAIVFQEMYRNGALESELVSGSNSFLRRPRLNPSPEMEKRFLDELSLAISLAEDRLRANRNDTAALYALGISYGLRCNYYWVVKKAWRDSLKDANASRRCHNRISELDPNNVDARLVQGLHDYIVGSLPWSYRMLGFMIGFHGDKEKGIRTVQDVAAHGNLNRLDASIFLCALYRRENQTRRAIPLVEELIQRFPRNYLLRLELSQMYSLAGDKEHALEAVEQIAALKTRHAPGYDRVPWEKIYFQQGTIEFWYRDFERSLDHFKRVIDGPDDQDLNTGVFSRMRVGQIYDLINRRGDAVEAYRKAIAYAPQSDAAQECRRYLTMPYRRT
jgi:tetratricopeptide (TPR) repeat protein